MPAARIAYRSRAYASTRSRGVRARTTYRRRVSAPSRYRPRVALSARRTYGRRSTLVRRRRARR